MWIFSNFAPCEVVYGEVTYPTLEHAYQAAKTMDPDWRQKILEVDTPGKAKRLGQKAPIQPDWDRIRVGVMDDLLRQKFAPGSDFRGKLDATGDDEIVEWNHWHDTTWGKCKCSKCGSKGINILGKLLMDIRDGIQRHYVVCMKHNHFAEDDCFYCQDEEENKDRLQEERTNDEIRREQDRLRQLQARQRKEKDQWTRWFHE